MNITDMAIINFRLENNLGMIVKNITQAMWNLNANVCNCGKNYLAIAKEAKDVYGKRLLCLNEVLNPRTGRASDIKNAFCNIVDKSVTVFIANLRRCASNRTPIECVNSLVRSLQININFPF